MADSLAWKIIRSAPPGVIDLDELVNVGLHAAWLAIERYDEARSVLTTFMQLRIRGAMLDHMRSMDFVPRLVRVQNAKLSAAERACYVRNDRPATDEELSEEMNVAVSTVVSYRLKSQRAAKSLSDVVLHNEGKNIERGEEIVDHTPKHPWFNLANMDLLRNAMRGFNKHERLIVICYLVEGDTMRQIGRQLDLSESRISQMYSGLLPRMQKNLRRLEEYSNLQPA